MKILKNILTIMVIIILLFGLTDIYAYDGLVDAESEITISETLVNGNGEISLTRNIKDYEMYYQYVEIDNELYKQIRKLKDELLIIQYYNIWEIDQTDENYDIYVSAYLYYEDKYNEVADDYTENRIDEIQSIITSLLPDYTEQWIRTTNNKINIDLSKFIGIKDYVVWVKINTEGRTIYDAEVYELEGTKTNNNDDENQKPGINIDLQDEIILPETLINGEGTVTVTRNIKNYQMYYQYIEIDSELYKQIRKLKDELLVAQYYNIWEIDQTDENYDIYESAYLYYKDKYNETVDDYTEKRIDEVQSIIISLLPQYVENWIPTTENKVNIDLSSFSGIKNYVVWVKVEADGRNIYDAEVYQLEGTKKENEKPVITLEDKVTLPEILINGEGTVNVSSNIKNYQMYYQYIEIDNVTYKKVKKLKDELLVAEYYNIWEANQTDENYDIYESAYLYYKDKYKETVDDYTEKRIDEIESIIIGLLPEYTENWIQTSNNKIKIDLSQFSGVKDYVFWVKVVDGDKVIYEKNVYEVTGTKKEDDNKPDDDNKPGEDDNKPGDDDNKPGDDDNKPGEDNNKPGDDDNKPGEDDNKPDNNNKVDNTNKDTSITKGDTTTSSKKMPYTGATSTIMQISIIGAIVMSIITFIRMKKIR